MKKHKACDLIGQFIKVDSGNDGTRTIGTIVSVKPEKGSAQIEFGNGTRENYAIEKLFMLASKAVIMQRLIGNWEISPIDFKTALMTCKLISEKNFAEAMKLATANDTVALLCTINCKSWLGIQNNRSKLKSLHT